MKRPGPCEHSGTSAITLNVLEFSLEPNIHSSPKAMTLDTEDRCSKFRNDPVQPPLGTDRKSEAPRTAPRSQGS